MWDPLSGLSENKLIHCLTNPQLACVDDKKGIPVGGAALGPLIDQKGAAKTEQYLADIKKGLPAYDGEDPS